MNKTKRYNKGMDPAISAGSILHISAGGLYVHVAYCKKKCIYCDFYSVGSRQADWEGYADALIAELRHRNDELPCPLRTIYIGGGTPSLMPPKDFLRLCETLYSYSDNIEEFTIEVNPDDVTPAMLEVWKRGGVNRLSMGIQSFDDYILKLIKRRHTAATAERAYTMACEVFDNISIDLIYGIPGQNVDMWRKDIAKAVSMHPEHISSYSLMYEEGTALTLLRDKGVLSEVSEEISETMMNILISELRKAGYEHYEISNFALPGFRSRHNSSYWQGTPYLGLGPSAHSYNGLRCRSATKADVRAYINYWKEEGARSETDIIQREFLSEEELREEYVMTRLRTKEGIDLEDFRCRFGAIEYQKLLEKSDIHIKEGSLILYDKHLFISEKALLISDSIIVALA